MIKKLSEQEIRELRSLHRSTKDRRFCDRIKCILLFDKGYSSAEICEILLIDDGTVSNWIQKFNNRESLYSWLGDNYKNYSGKLNDEQIATVEKYVSENIISDSKQLIVFIEKEMSIKYSESGIIALLHRLGYKYKHTTLVPSGIDPGKQKEFKEKYEDLEKKLETEEVVLFVDGVHPQHNTICSKAWIKEGKRIEVQSNTGRNRINIQGGYNPKTQEVVIHEDITLNAENTISFFKKIEESYPDKSKIYLILDNARYYKNNKVKEYVENSRIELIFLPPYSPNLNLIERLWKFMRIKIINNRFYEKFSIFKKTIIDFFENIGIYKKELESFIGNRLHLIRI